MSDVEPELREPATVENVIDRRCTIYPLCQDKGDYVLPAQCSNCGWKGSVIQTRGHSLSRYGLSPECPYCGCREVRILPQWAAKADGVD